MSESEFLEQNSRTLDSTNAVEFFTTEVREYLEHAFIKKGVNFRVTDEFYPKLAQAYADFEGVVVLSYPTDNKIFFHETFSTISDMMYSKTGKVFQISLDNPRKHKGHYTGKLTIRFYFSS